MSDTIVSAAPLVAALSPLVNAAVSGLVIGVGGLVFAGLAKWTGIAFTPDKQAELEKAADSEVQAAIAKAENNLATGKFDVRNPVVASVANALAANAPAIVADLSLSADQVNDAVVKAIGRAQQQMTKVDPAAGPKP
jgi:hypothetical protein